MNWNLDDIEIENKYLSNKLRDELFLASEIILFIPKKHLNIIDGINNWDYLWKKEKTCFIHITHSNLTPAFFKIDLNLIINNITNKKYQRIIKINKLSL